MTDYEQPDLFGIQHTPATARGPVQSQLTVASLGRDASLKKLIARAVLHRASHSQLRHSSDGDAFAILYDLPVTDDDITEHCERVTGRRFQRNVIARTRGLMERDGWFVPVPDVIGRTGRPTHAIIPSRRLIEMNP